MQIQRKNDGMEELAEREVRVEALKASLEKYENAFNFVGLFQGFDELSKEKTKEKKGTLFWLKCFGFLSTVPLIAEMVVLYLNRTDLSDVKHALLLSIIPTVSLVAVFIYYFRILLYNYKATKSQLLQIELRKTLCRFI